MIAPPINAIIAQSGLTGAFVVVGGGTRASDAETRMFCPATTWPVVEYGVYPSSLICTV